MLLNKIGKEIWMALWGRLHTKLDFEQRTYNTRQLLEILSTLNGVYLSSRQLRRILKKKLLMEENKKLK